MAHYKPYNLDQFELMAIDLRAQILPGSLEAALSTGTTAAAESVDPTQADSRHLANKP